MKLSIPCSYKLQVQPHVSSPMTVNMPPRYFRRKEKAVFVVGPTGTGKSRLAIDLATRFPAEIINCDKIQVHKGLDIVTNKVTEEEKQGVSHHLLGSIDPNAQFTADDFGSHASAVTESLLMRDKLPIIAGGSNSFIEALVNDDPEFWMRYDCCFLWVDVSLPVLHSLLSERVDRMVEAGLVDEVRQTFDFNNSDYSQGIRRAIGVPELDYYFRNEAFMGPKNRAKVLDRAIAKIKENTYLLACRQLQKIHRLHSRHFWNMHRIDATEVFLRKGMDANEAWDKLVSGPGTLIVDQFLYDRNHVSSILPVDVVPSLASVAAATSDRFPLPVPAMTAAAATW